MSKLGTKYRLQCYQINDTASRLSVGLREHNDFLHFNTIGERRLARVNGNRKLNRSVVEGLRVFLVMVILASSFGPMFASADVVWEDNFDDPNLPGWTIFGYENEFSQVTIEGNFSAASGVLEVLDDGMNFARHNSTTNVGTWSFDMFVPANEEV